MKKKILTLLLTVTALGVIPFQFMLVTPTLPKRMNATK